VIVAEGVHLERPWLARPSGARRQRKPALERAQPSESSGAVWVGGPRVPCRRRRPLERACLANPAERLGSGPAGRSSREGRRSAARGAIAFCVAGAAVGSGPLLVPRRSREPSVARWPGRPPLGTGSRPVTCHASAALGLRQAISSMGVGAPWSSARRRARSLAEGKVWFE